MTGGLDSPSFPEVSIHAIGAGGVGVGNTPDGKVAFVPRTAPGDRVRMQPIRVKPRWVLGRASQWLEEGSARRTPPCPLYDRCDGCSLQHLAYLEQLKWKGRMVGDALRRIGGLVWEDPGVTPSPRELRYRNKITLTLRRLPGGKVVAGFRELWNRSRVLDVAGLCLLPTEELATIWDALRLAWGPDASLLPQGRELRLTLRGFGQGGGLLVRGGRGDGDPNQLLPRVDGLRAIWKEPRGGPQRLLAGDPTLRVEWLEESLEIPGGGFLQVNRDAGERLHGYVLEESGGVAGRRVLDCYCGVGILGRALAERGAEVVGIEADPLGAAVAKTGAPDGFRVLEGQVEAQIHGLLPAELLIVNPPRSGLDPAIPRILTGRTVPRMIYVSCDPATLARDLKRLQGSYQIEKVGAFDLFPQTDHVETVVTMTGKDG